MKKDHYTVLGVTPASEDVAIRAAYRALMRRYHPDADPSPEAAEKAREINEAYRVLSERERRARYDDEQAASSPLKFDPQWHREVEAGRGSRIAPLAALGVAVAAVGMIVFAVSPTVRDFFVVPTADVRATIPVAPAAVATTAKPTSKAVLDPCSDPSADDLIKREIFRLAADRPAVDRKLLDEVASRADIRVRSGSAARSGSGGCSGWLAIDLPRGLVVDGGRTNLNADVTFGIERGGGGLRLARLSGANSLVRSLATLGPEPKEPETKQVASVEPVRTGPKSTKLAARARPETKAPSVAAQTACDGVSSGPDRMICANSNLASLDRQLALLYGQSWKQADETKRAALVGTRQRFNERRDACGSPNCMTTAYVSRLREISDIMAGKPPQ